MAESKKRLYKRETGTKAIRLMMRKAEMIIENPEEFYVYGVRNIVLFGSYLKGSYQIHDVDILIDLYGKWKGVKEGRDLKMRFNREHPELYGRGFFEDALAAYYFTLRQLKNRKGILSFHEYVMEYEMFNDKKEPYVFLVRNEEITDCGKLFLDEAQTEEDIRSWLVALHCDSKEFRRDESSEM